MILTINFRQPYDLRTARKSISRLLALLLISSVSDDDKTMAEQRFIEAVAEYSDVINRICRSFAGKQTEFEDLRQDALTNIWIGLRKFRGESDLKSWIYRVTFNTCVSTYRQTRTLREITSRGSENFSEPASEDTRDRIEDSEWLLTALNTLTPDNHAIIAMWLDDLSYEEIAKVMGMNKNTIATRVRRIKDHLQKMANQQKI